MQVFVANPTLLHRDLQYRYPGQKTIRVVKIAAGGQAKLPDDLDGAVLENVLRQLKTIGAVPASEVGYINAPKALIFDVRANPINIDKITEGLEKDEEARQELSSEKMEAAGLGAFKIAEKAQSAAGKGKIVETTVEIVEMTERGKTKDGVNVEYVTSAKPSRRAGKKREEDKH
jgi:hypothetical protein